MPSFEVQIRTGVHRIAEEGVVLTEMARQQALQ
jgi:hypothetical protein